MNAQYDKTNKSSFKRNCRYYKKYMYKKIKCFKYKKKRIKMNKQGFPSTLVHFEYNVIDILSKLGG